MNDKNTNLIIGKAGSGKTRGILLRKVKELITRNENMVILDNKLEYFSTFGKELVDKGYEVKVLNIRDTEKTDCWNPLLLPYKLYKDGKKDIAIDMIQNLARGLFLPENKNIDPFWEKTASDYFTGLALILFKDGKEDEINIGSIGAMLGSVEEKINDSTLINEYIKKLDPIDPIYTFLSPTVFAPCDTRGSIMSVLRQKLNIILSKDNLLNALCNNDIDILSNKKQAIFVVGSIPSQNFLVATFINQIISSQLFMNTKYNFILDNIETVPGFLVDLETLLDYANRKDYFVYVAVKSKDEMNGNYGSFILDKFVSVTEVNNIDDLLDIGNYNALPISKLIKHNYYSLKG